MVKKRVKINKKTYLVFIGLSLSVRLLRVLKGLPYIDPEPPLWKGVHLSESGSKLTLVPPAKLELTFAMCCSTLVQSMAKTNLLSGFFRIKPNNMKVKAMSWGCIEVSDCIAWIVNCRWFRWLFMYSEIKEKRNLESNYKLGIQMTFFEPPFQ